MIEGRTVLEEKLSQLTEQYAHAEPERPPFWGGHRLVPAVFEFWQGGVHRLHDRLAYRREAAGPWRIERLSP